MEELQELKEVMKSWDREDRSLMRTLEEETVWRERQLNWEAAADGEVQYDKEGNGMQHWDEDMICIDADDAEFVHDVEDAEGMGQECVEGDKRTITSWTTLQCMTR